MNIIDINNLKFRYRNDLPWVLDVKNFSVKRGERIFLFGPSGFGKTTFLEILAGVLAPEEGDFRFLNFNINSLSLHQRDVVRAAHIGYIFQSFNLIPYLSVEENILLPLYLSVERRKKVPLGDQQKEVKNLCEDLGIGELARKNVVELSVGQQQRVAVARALLGKPELILADEPTSALDQGHREMFIRLLFEVCKRDGTTVLFVSHDRTLARLFDRAVSLKDINFAGIK